MLGTNTRAYYEKFVSYGQKKFYNIGPRLEVTDTANALADYNTETITAVKSFIV